MSFIVKAGEASSFKPVPSGMHLSRCYRIVDLGTQQSEYMGVVKNLPKVMLQFEVHSEDESGQPLLTAKGEPMSIAKNYTVSLGENATLRADLKNWRGRDFTAEELRGFELANVLGHWAMITVAKTIGNNGKEYTNITTINPVPPNIKKGGLPEAHNEPKMFTISNPDMELFNSFSDNLKMKIEKSPEWQSRFTTHSSAPARVTSNAQLPEYDLNDDVPF
jgi:hypothetical protein